jgi:hypothetical protein
MQGNNTRRWAAFAVALLVALGTSVGEAQVIRKDTFPKIGGYYINGTAYAEADHRADIAKLDFAVISMWRGWQINGMSITDVVKDIRSRANAAGNEDLILSMYTMFMESASSPDNSAKLDVWNKMSEERGPGGAAVDWWARNTKGENVSTWPGAWNTNITRFVVPDANGDRVPQWKAKRDFSAYSLASPQLDSVFADSWFWRPRSVADWNGDGINDDKNDPTVQRWYRLGMVDWLDQVTKLRPDVLVMGNVDGQIWAGNGMLSEPEYKGKLGGALFEGAMGASWSIETNGKWEDMMRFYRSLLANTKAPHIVLFGVMGDDAQDYQTFRYALASTLMDDGYLAYNVDGYGEVHWYDEYDLAGTAGTDWLGRAISEPPTSPWSKGVYRRDFENGIALVNPKGNGSRTVTVEPGFVRIAGTQDPAVNNGEPARDITLPERDGILLVREERISMQDKPNPPVLSLQ